MVAPSHTGLKIRPKKKIVVDLLCLCVEHSRLVEKLSVDTVRYVVESALGEIYREGEFRLEPLWTILAKEPGLEIEMSAAPLLAFKSLDEQANLRIRLPADVIGLAPLKASELRKQVELPIARLTPLLDELRAADVNSAADVEARAARNVTGRNSSARAPRASGIMDVTGPTAKAAPNSQRMRMLLILAGLSVALVGALWFAFK